MCGIVRKEHNCNDLYSVLYLGFNMGCFALLLVHLAPTLSLSVPCLFIVSPDMSNHELYRIQFKSIVCLHMCMCSNTRLQNRARYSRKLSTILLVISAIMIFL